MLPFLLACAFPGSFTTGGSVWWPGLVVADGFDFPVGAPDGKGYYDAQPFGTNRHLGGDWNGRGGGNSDFGDPVYCAADGVVTEAEDQGGGWGNVVRVAHRLPSGQIVETLYAHLSEIAVAPGTVAQRGALLGKIGDAGGQYRAHLHFELRERTDAPLGGGYGEADGQVDPTAFILAHRAVRRVARKGG